MKNTILWLAVPFFVISMIAEGIYSRRKRLKLYETSDTATNLLSGLGSQILGGVFGVVPLVGYGWIYDNLRVWTMSEGLAWVLGFFGVDLCYYWYHRTSHRVNFFWATHIVHHQSDEYNLSVALRQPWFSTPFSWVFYIPLAILGIPFHVFATHGAVSLLYQFWIHTKTIDRMGSAEAWLNTPSHHRVHHGSNPVYLDKNYAGIFIVWDRWFGTFVPETEPVKYGLTTPEKSRNALWVNVTYWRELLVTAVRAPSLYEAVMVWIRGPEWKARWMKPGHELPVPTAAEVATR